MALLQLPPILAAAALPSHLEKLPTTKAARITLSTTQSPSNPRHHQLKKNRHKLSAVAEGIAAAAGDESVIQEDEAVEHKESSARYDWTEEWYPLYLTKQVPDDAPLGLTVFDKQVVLFKDGDGVIRCYEDRCPHRLAKLSEGQLYDGRLECLYHGWQFEGNGKCVKIPQVYCYLQ